MVKQRSIATSIILTIVTCGIYGLVWYYSMNNDVVAKSNGRHTTSGGTAIVLSLLTCGIYSIYWNYKMGEQLDQIKAERGIAPANRKIVYLILTFFGLGIVSWALIQSELNEIADA